MTAFKDEASNSVHNSVIQFSQPPSTLRPTQARLTLAEANDLWAHATLLYHNLEWEQALTTHRRILRFCGPDIRRTCLWFNIGLIRALLGEYWLAARSFAQALSLEPDFAISQYCLGICYFQIYKFGKAKHWFDKCLKSLTEEKIDYWHQGLDFVLEKTRVDWNSRQALHEKRYKQRRVPLPFSTHMGLNRLPAGRIFEPLCLENDELVNAGAFPTATSESLPVRAESFTRLRTGLRTLLGRHRQSKQSSTFEHSNARLLALEDETTSDVELSKEAVVPILAPSARRNLLNQQSRPKKVHPILASQPSKDGMVPFSSSTWPVEAKPPIQLPFVTAKDLPTSPPNRHLRKWTARLRSYSTPQSSLPLFRNSLSQELGAEAEVIPTTTDLDEFMTTAPMAYVPALPNFHPSDRPAAATYVPSPPSSHPSTIPAPLSTIRAQGNRLIMAPKSPSSLYSTPFSPDAISNPQNTPPNPMDIPTTHTTLHPDSIPPRWDSLPTHLRPHARSDQRRHHRHSIATPISTPTLTMTSNVNILPPVHDDHCVPASNGKIASSEYAFNNPDRFASPMTMDSFDIVGMGRRDTDERGRGEGAATRADGRKDKGGRREGGTWPWR